MNTEHVRVPLVQPGTRPELAEIEGRILEERGRISLLYQVLLNSEPIAAGWERMLTAVRNQTGVPADLRELMILRVAVLNGAEFEFDAHIPHAQRAGISAAKIAASREPTLSTEFSALETLVLELTDAMTRDIVVPDALMDRLRDHFESRACRGRRDRRRVQHGVAIARGPECRSLIGRRYERSVDVRGGKHGLGQLRRDRRLGNLVDSGRHVGPDVWRRRAARQRDWVDLSAIHSWRVVEKATHHYAVETDVAEQDEADFNAWLEQEHLPGLARVPGTVIARRFLRGSGAPRYIACYDLTTPATLEHPAWLAVRHTAWSRRIRPLFRNTRRTMFVLG